MAATSQSGGRRLFIGGNWKMASTKETISTVTSAINAMESLPANADIFLAPPALHIQATKEALTKDVLIGAQNIHSHEGFGAFTGEHSAAMLKDFGVDWVIVGHSERRHIFGDSLDTCAAKAKVALDAGLSVVFCVGEQLEEQEAGKTMEVVEGQLKPLAHSISSEQWGRVVIAYEPVWAIGTGKTASPAQAQESISDIRSWLEENVSVDVGTATRIIYGGSVKPSNCKSLISLSDIDGFLVGGASLKADFTAIIASASEA